MVVLVERSSCIWSTSSRSLRSPFRWPRCPPWRRQLEDSTTGREHTSNGLSHCKADKNSSEFAPPSLQKSISYIVGWLSTLSWCCGACSGFFLAGSLIQGCIVELHESYAAEPWKAYLFILCLATVVALVNTFLSRQLPRLEVIAFVLTIAGFVSIIVVLLVLSSGNVLSASEVFGTFSNDGGWSSLGLSMVAGQALLVWLLVGRSSRRAADDES